MNKIFKKQNKKELEAFILKNFPDTKPIIENVIGILTSAHRALFFKRGDQDILGVRLDGETIVFFPLETVRRYEKDFYIDDVFVKIGAKRVFVGNSVAVVSNYELRNNISNAMIFESLYPKGYIFYREIQNGEDLGTPIKEFGDAKVYESEEESLQIVFNYKGKTYTAPVSKEENVYKVILASGSENLVKEEFAEDEQYVMEDLSKAIQIIENIKPEEQPRSKFLDDIEFDSSLNDDSSNKPDGLVDEDIKTDTVSTTLFTKL